MKNTITLHYKANISITVTAKLSDTNAAVEKFCEAIKDYEKFELKSFREEIKEKS